MNVLILLYFIYEINLRLTLRTLWDMQLAGYGLYTTPVKLIITRTVGITFHTLVFRKEDSCHMISTENFS
jgi:hypothetical protein